MSADDSQGCPEYNELTRRGFLQTAAGSAAMLAAAAAAPAWLPRVALAGSHRATLRNVVISVYLRGGADGMSMVVPYADPHYYQARPLLAVAPPDSTASIRCSDLNGFFGFHNAMNPLLPVYREGKLAIIHACGSTDITRSHFDGQRFMESGADGTLGVPTGWLGRHLATADPLSSTSLLRAVGISTGLPRSLLGGPKAIPVPNLASFGLGGTSGTVAARTAALQEMYAAVGDPQHAVATTTLATIDLLRQIDFANYQPSGGAAYLTNAFGNSLKATAALIKAGVGVEAVAIDLNGWDTHSEQGLAGGGAMFNLMSTLSNNMLAFYRDMTAGASPGFMFVAMSEFGRRLAENGSRGTDHGHGNCMLVMGQQINGGRVLADWPGLAPDRLFQGLDLDVTIDYRDVLAEIVQFGLGNYNLPEVFPAFDPTMRGIIL